MQKKNELKYWSYYIGKRKKKKKKLYFRVTTTSISINIIESLKEFTMYNLQILLTVQ